MDDPESCYSYDDDSMRDSIINWSKVDYANQNYFIKRIKQIPSTFNSSSEYFNAFKIPHLSETKQNIFNEWEDLEDCSSYRKVAISISEISCGFQSLISFTVAYDSKIKILPLDVVILTKCDDGFLFRDNPDLFLIGYLDNVIVPKHPEMLKGKSVTIKVTLATCLHPSMLQFQSLNNDNTEWCITKISSILSQARIEDALRREKCPSFMPIILGKESIKEYPSLESHKVSIIIQKINALISIQNKDLNNSQKNAIITVAAICDNESKKSPFILRGPPGTGTSNYRLKIGKTHTIVTLLFFLYGLNMRILQTAPTNIAVSEIAIRFIQQAIATKLVPLREIILVCAKEQNISNTEDLSLIYVEERISKIKYALSNFNDSLYCLKRLTLDSKNELKYLKETPPNEDSWHNVYLDLAYMYADLKTLAVRDFVITFGSHVILKLKSMIFSIIHFLPKSHYESLQISVVDNLQRNLDTLHDLLQDKRFCLNKNIMDSVNSLKGLYFNSTWLKNEYNWTKHLINESKIVFSTVNVAGRKVMQETILGIDELALPIDIVIIDEASQIPEAESAIILSPFLKTIVLVGDEKQLGAAIFSKEAKDANYGRSLFERLVKELKYPVKTLNVQYRMAPEISKFPLAQFYENQVSNGPNVLLYDKPWYKHLAGYFGPLVFFNVKGIEKKNLKSSISNPVEAAVISEIIVKVCEAYPHEPICIGIISAYQFQTEQLEQMISDLSRKFPQTIKLDSIKGNANDQKINIKVKNVDGFQGQERDIIIFSTVRCNNRGEIGFLKELRRLNVAITRAKFSLWIVGDKETLSRNIIWSRLISHIIENGEISDCEQDSGFSNVIIKAHMNDMTTSIREGKDIDMAVLSKALKNSIWKFQFSQKSVSALKSMTEGLFKSILSLISDVFGDGYSKKHISGYSINNISNFLRVLHFRAQKMVIIWTISLNAELKCQVIKIWDIGSSNSIYQSVSAVTMALNRHSDAFFQACSKVLANSNLKFIPDYYTNFSNNWYQQPNLISENENEILNESSIELVKSYSFTEEILNELNSKSLKDIVLPYSLDPKEVELIRTPATLFIIGRSGTGKTTVSLRKMLYNQSEFFNNLNLYSDSLGSLQQLFVTSSPRLSENIIVEYGKLIKPFSSDVLLNTTKSLHCLSELKTSKVSTTTILSFFDFVKFLDKGVGEPFFKYDEKEHAIYLKRSEDILGNASHSKRKTKYYEVGEVNFWEFKKCYFPHFNQELTSRMDDMSLWTEFFSVIKGSSPKLLHIGRLDKDQYLKLEGVRGSIYNRNDREMIYEAFLKYEAMKESKNQWDLMDFTYYVYQKLNGDTKTFHFIYVDEVQDLNMLQIALFSFLGYQKNGYVFGGDTAQTISSGVSFRFQNIRELFFTDFLPNFGDENYKLEPLHHLKVNYRSHDGILALAHTLVELLINFFPYGIDKLLPEKGLISGAIPSFFQIPLGSLMQKIFGAMEKQSGSEKFIELGAQHVIIVRDKSTKKEVQNIIGDRGLVLTVFETKGLEFDFVILYNFFQSSNFDHWRVILFDKEDSKFKKFDSYKHSMLEKELKELYVAITRSKKVVFVVEEEISEKYEPLLNIWKEKKLIKTDCFENVIEDMNFINTLISNSTAAEWIEKGDSLMENKLFKEAKRCYIRGFDSHKVKLSEAWSILQDAEESKNEKQSSILFNTAASLFASLKMWKLAADAFFRAKEFKKAAELFLKTGIPSDVVSALTMCFIGKIPQLFLDIIKERQVDKKEKNELCKKFALYERSIKHMRFFKLFVLELDSLDRVLLLKRYGHFDILLDIEVSSFKETGVISDLMGDLHKEAGLLLDASFFYEKLNHRKHSFDCLIGLLRQWIPSIWKNGNILKNDIQAAEIFSKIIEAQRNISTSQNINYEVKLWKFVFHDHSLTEYLELFLLIKKSLSSYLKMFFFILVTIKIREELDNNKDALFNHIHDNRTTFIKMASDFQELGNRIKNDIYKLSKMSKLDDLMNSFFGLENCSGSDNYKYFVEVKSFSNEDFKNQNREIGTLAGFKKKSVLFVQSNLRLSAICWVDLLEKYYYNYASKDIGDAKSKIGTLIFFEIYKTVYSIILYWKKLKMVSDNFASLKITQIIAALKSNGDFDAEAVGISRRDPLIRAFIDDCRLSTFQSYNKDMIPNSATNSLMLSLINRNMPLETYSIIDRNFGTVQSVMSLKNMVLSEIASPETNQYYSNLWYASENGIYFLTSINYRAKNFQTLIGFQHIVILFERMMAFILLLEFKFKNIKVTEYMLHVIYKENWENICHLCNVDAKYNTWALAIQLCRVIGYLLDNNGEVFRGIIKNNQISMNLEFNYFVRIIKILIIFMDHFYRDICPVRKYTINLCKKLEKTSQELGKNNPLFKGLTEKLKVFEDVYGHRISEIACKFFKETNDELVLLSDDNKSLIWAPWMNDYRRFRVTFVDQLKFTEFTERDLQELECDNSKKETNDENDDAGAISSAPARKTNEVLPPEALINPKFITILKNMAQNAKDQLQIIKRNLMLPDSDIKKITSEMEYFFKRGGRCLSSDLKSAFMNEGCILKSRLIIHQQTVADYESHFNSERMKAICEKENHVHHENMDAIYEWKEKFSKNISIMNQISRGEIEFKHNFTRIRKFIDEFESDELMVWISSKIKKTKGRFLSKNK